MASPREAHELRSGVLRVALALECPGQYPAPQDIKRSFVQLLELGFVHIGEGNAAGMFAECAVRQLDRVVVTGFDGYPGAVGIELLTGTDAACALISDAIEILLSGIQQRPFVPAVGGQKSGIAGNQLAFVGRDRPASWLPVFKPEVQKREEAAMESRITDLFEVGHQHGAELNF